MKDGQCLSDGEDYCDTETDNILVIKHACQEMEGQYSCFVESNNGKEHSSIIVLSVIFSPEKKRLIDLYSKRTAVPKDTWPPVCTKTFINLALIERDGICFHEYVISVQDNMDDFIKSKETIEYEKVFGIYEKGCVVLVEGRPGSGKSTLVHKVARDWALKRTTLKNAELVFLVPLRLLEVDRTYTLSDILGLFFENCMM